MEKKEEKIVNLSEGTTGVPTHDSEQFERLMREQESEKKK